MFRTVPVTTTAARRSACRSHPTTPRRRGSPRPQAADRCALLHARDERLLAWPDARDPESAIAGRLRAPSPWWPARAGARCARGTTTSPARAGRAGRRRRGGRDARRSGTLRSRHVAEPVDYAVGLPPGRVRRAAVCLPGRGSDARWVDGHAARGRLRRRRRPALRRRRGRRRRVLLAPARVGRGSHAHAARRVPAAARPPLRPAPAGRHGLVDGRLRRAACSRAAPGAFRPVAVSSAAIWPTYAQQHAAVPDAFDGAGRLRPKRRLRRLRPARRTAVSISCGTADPFLANDRAFAARLAHRPGRRVRRRLPRRGLLAADAAGAGALRRPASRIVQVPGTAPRCQAPATACYGRTSGL